MAGTLYPKYVFEKKIKDEKWQSVLDELRQQERAFVTEHGVLEKLEELIGRIEELAGSIAPILQAIARGIKSEGEVTRYDGGGRRYYAQTSYGHIQKPFRTRSEQMMAALFIRDQKLLPFLKELEAMLSRLMVVSREEIKKDEALAVKVTGLVKEERAIAGKTWTSKPFAEAEKDLIEEERKGKTTVVKLEKEEFEFLHHVRLFYSVVEDLKITLESDLQKLRGEYRQQNWHLKAPALANQLLTDLKRLFQELKKYGKRLQKEFEEKAVGEKFLEQLMRKIDILQRKTTEVKSLVEKRKKFTYY